jgi:hypothetical protein
MKTVSRIIMGSIMKKNIILIMFFCYISIYAQSNVDSADVLTAIKKNYLYNLTQINANTILTIEPHRKEVPVTPLIATTLNIKLQIKETDNISFIIREKEGCEPLKECGLYASVYFIVLKNTKGFSKKSGEGDYVPVPAPIAYRWVLNGDVLIFIFTDGYQQLSNKYQRYVYLPAAE